MTTAPDPGTRCPLHPLEAATGTCSRCGTFGCDRCLQDHDGQWVCDSCRGDRAEGLPWSRRSELGMVNAAWQTVKLVSASPSRAFDGLSGPGGVGEAMLFALAVAVPVAIVGALYGLAINAGMMPLMFKMMEGFGVSVPAGVLDQSLKQALFALPVGMLLGGPATVLGLLIMGVFHHIFLSLFGGGKSGFDATLKGALYASAVSIWGVIPLVNFITSMWVAIVMGVAYGKIHGDPPWKGHAAVWTPVLLIFCCVGLIVAVGAFAAVSLGDTAF